MPLLVDPRAPFPTQFPQQPLMDPQSLAMIQRRMLGGAPQGLLDTSNAQAGLLGPATVRPGAAAGLLTPVIWDQLRRGLSPMTTTEGARMGGAQGGGGRGFAPTNQYPLDLRGGRGTAPPEPKWRPQWGPDETGEGDYGTTTPSGLQVSMTQKGDNTVSVLFHEPEKSLRAVYGSGEGSTKRSLDRFGEVFTAVKDYVDGYQPDRVTFSSASDSHKRLYDRLAPLLANELGGRLARASEGHYAIDLIGPNTRRGMP